VIARHPGDAPRLFVVPDDEPGAELAVPGEQGPDVLDGEIVDGPSDDEDDEGGALNPVVEHAVYVAAGVVVVARRVWESRSTGSYDRMVRAAISVGDQEHALEWEARREAFRRDRHARRFEWIELPARVLGTLPKLGAVTGGGLVVLGALLAVATRDVRQVIAPILWVATLVHVVVVVVSVGWLPALTLAGLGAGVGLWRVGLRSAEAGEIDWIPGRYVGDDEGEPITPSIVVTALRDLGLSALRKAVADMGDAGAAMLSPITVAGCGVEVDVTLPSGTSTQEVMSRGRKLAENLGRHEHEVFLTVAPKARTVRMWIADSGALDEPIGASPLVTDPNIRADYYSGRAPWGRTLRGAMATVNLFQQHLLITGKSNQGKTASLRALLLWLALDPTVEFCIADLKGVGDWSMFEGLATELIEGPTDEDCMAATHMVEGRVEEMNRRLTALKESGSDDGVTREMARSDGFHPLIVVVDEAQKVFMCPAVGPDKRPYGGKKHTSRFYNAVREIQNQGRVVNVTIHLGVQDPTDENLPKIVREPAHLRIALYLATESQARMALGEAPVEQGAAPHKLRDGIDRGTVVAHGPGIEVPRGDPAVTIRTFFIDGKAAAQIAERAKARRARVATRRTELPKARNLLADLDEVLGDLPAGERVRLADLPALLRDLAPDHKPYEPITGTDIKDRLDSYEIKTTNTHNVPRLDPADLRDGIARLGVR
jgi:S-DNA-T family DNA segregation ATPase FtsK/SpoIIIE